MVSGKAHKMDARAAGYSNEVNRQIDLAFEILGRGHRVIAHTPEEVVRIGYAVDGPRGARGGLRHLMLDSIKDRNQRMAIEFAAVLAETHGSRRRGKIKVVGSGA